ncbi:NAD(P)-binding protein [Xylariomycetidae sp. FL2044]|nr:NAD(P)-binding protein [Xylariomycetidae sp. FL2044]
MASIKELWYDARHPPAVPKDLAFKDKAVLVIGAHGAGLGHFAAAKYAALGANPVILAVRTIEKGEQAKSDIIRQTGCSPDIFLIEPIDLASFASVMDFADRVKKRVPDLHVLQIAGGVAPWNYAKTPDGFEMALQVDVLSPTLLTLLLLPKLRQTAVSPDGYRPHISILDSIAIFMIPDDVLPVDGQTLVQRCDDETKWDSIQQYFLIKLATWYVSQRIAKLCDDSSIIVNATCPGLCNTNMTKDLPLSYRGFMAIRYFFLGRTAEQGARSLVSATSLGPESHGKLWNNDRFHPMTPFLDSERSDTMCQETWDEILSILRKHVGPGLI